MAFTQPRNLKFLSFSPPIQKRNSLDRQTRAEEEQMPLCRQCFWGSVMTGYFLFQKLLKAYLKHKSPHQGGHRVHSQRGITATLYQSKHPAELVQLYRNVERKCVLSSTRLFQKCSPSQRWRACLRSHHRLLGIHLKNPGNQQITSLKSVNSTMHLTTDEDVGDGNCTLPAYEKRRRKQGHQAILLCYNGKRKNKLSFPFLLWRASLKSAV